MEPIIGGPARPVAKPNVIEIFFEGKQESMEVIDTGGNIIKYLLGEDRICPLIGAEIKLTKKLGRGVAGSAFEITFPGIGTNEYVAKRTQRGDREDKPCLPDGAGYKKTDESGTLIYVKKGSYACDSLYTEYIISFVVSNLFRKQISVNFMDVFYFSTCPPVAGDEDAEETEIREENGEPNRGKHYTFMEKIDGSVLKLWKAGKLNNMDQLFFQVVHAIAVYQENYNIVHGDLHADNMFVKFVDGGAAVTQYEYTVGTTKFYIPAGPIIKIGDWGLSVMYRKDGTVIGDDFTLATGYNQRDGNGPWLPNFYTKAYDVIYAAMAFHILDKSNELVKDTLAFAFGLKEGYDNVAFQVKLKTLCGTNARPLVKYLENEFKHVTPLTILENVKGFKKFLVKGSGESFNMGSGVAASLWFSKQKSPGKLPQSPQKSLKKSPKKSHKSPKKSAKKSPYKPVVETKGTFPNPGYMTKVNGVFQSIDGFPALITKTGSQVWYEKGLVHRDNDLPAIIRSNGDRTWYQYDKISRTTGPAIIYANGNKDYVIDGVRTSPF